MWLLCTTTASVSGDYVGPEISNLLSNRENRKLFLLKKNTFNGVIKEGSSQEVTFESFLKW